MPFDIQDLEEHGFRLPSVAEFVAMLTSIESPLDKHPINNYGAITSFDDDYLFPVRTSESHFRFMPGPEFSPRLYRGQIEYFSRCTPSLYREDPGLARLIRIIKWAELSLLLQQHPATLDLAHSRIGPLRFDFNIRSIAQHYGFGTDLLDFSRSKDIAMFFATCREIDGSGEYVAAEPGSKTVLYTVAVKSMRESRRGNESWFLPLGFEPLPRPEAQAAVAISLFEGENLNDMPWATREEFKVTPDLSSRYLTMFDGGAKLFPADPFDDVVASLKNGPQIAEAALRIAFELGHTPEHPNGFSGACEKLEAAGYSITADCPSIEPEKIEEASKNRAEASKRFYDRIKCRGVCDHLVID